MNLKITAGDVECFQVLISMLETLNLTCIKLMESGHNPECCLALLTVMNASYDLNVGVNNLHSKMLERLGDSVNLTLLGDDNGNSPKE